MAKVTHVNTVCLAKLFSICAAFVGLMFGLVYSIGGAIYDLAQTGSLNVGSALAFLALLGMPVIFSLVSALVAFAGGWAFNIFAPLMGGIEVKLE